jgi:hypothetical protein
MIFGKFHKILLLATGAAASVLAVSSADATVITTNYTFTGDFGTSAPYQDLSGTFSVDFNTATHVFTLSALALTIGATTFTTSNSGLTTNGSLLYIGGNALQPSGISSINSNDFLLDFGFNATTGKLGALNVFKYAVKGHVGLLQAGTYSASVVQAAVPEPASWLTMIGGFGLVGGVLRRRKQATVRFA